jgi:hypothetical protein
VQEEDNARLSLHRPEAIHPSGKYPFKVEVAVSRSLLRPLGQPTEHQSRRRSLFYSQLLIPLANSSRASGFHGFAFPARLILPFYRPNDPRREFADGIRCYQNPEETVAQPDPGPAAPTRREDATVDLGSPAPPDGLGPARVRYFGDYEIDR